MADLHNNKLFDCTGLVAVVTGGGTGIGLTWARALESNGATVFIIGRRLDKLTEAATTYSTAQRLIPLQGDVTSKDDLERIASHIKEETGYVNLVIANSGIIGPSNRALLPREDDGSMPTIEEVQKALWDTPMQSVTDTYHVNVTGAIYTAIAFLDLLDNGNRQGNVKQTSQVLVTSSIGAYHRSWTQVGLAYTTSKAAVSHMVKSLASFLIHYRIRVNGIIPGLFPSEIMNAIWGDRDTTVEGALPKSIQPMGRAGKEEELAGTVLYFASEAGAYCSGTLHLVDGGRLIVMPGATY